MNYYDELFITLDKYFKEEKYDLVKSIVEEELKVVYVPKDVEEKLKKIYEDLPQDEYNFSISDEKIEEYLKGSYERQLRAVEELNRRNLRDYYDLCNDYLKGSGFVNAKVLLIESLIRQEISDEYTYINEGIEYNFIPRYVMLPEESLGFQKAYKLLEDIFMKDPSMFQMSKSLLYKECLMALPISYDEQEGESLALKIKEYILEAFK